MAMKVGRKALEQLLSATSREQHINGKSQKQVSGCVLLLADKVVSTTSIVKDGKTSLSRFSITTDSEGDETVPVPDIERMLGVLKYHGDYVTLSYQSDKGKVLVKSTNKQTTLVGGFDAKAFSNSQDTLKEWQKEAHARAEQIKGNVYMTKDKETIAPFFVAELAADVLYDALRCDGVNGQKLNRYTFEVKDGALQLTVGDVFKGQTTVDFGAHTCKDFEATFEGGLDYIVKHYSNNIKLSFLDFSEYGQGTRLLLTMDNGDWVFQAGVL
tara:strand:+ start:2821 stop:3630 length:810 start_codon:yes stop_codon:yes gene_type:complete